jgi:D-glycero-D-manno-heptose 1,7-bisphosphate phosphatase
MVANKALFLDRDGTLIEEAGYLRAPKDIRIIPGSLEAVRRANESGFLAAVVSNQSGVARGLLSEREMLRIQDLVRQAFEKGGARLDAFYYCPHHWEEGKGEYRIRCSCRKPGPGLLFRAAGELDIDLAASYMVGDKLLDVETGHRAGCRGILVQTGYGAQQWKEISGKKDFLEPLSLPDHVAGDLLGAVQWILEQEVRL